MRWPICFVVAIGFVANVSAEEPSPGNGFVSLFDGRTLNGWTGNKDSYRVEDGKIVCVEKSSGNLLTEKEYGDFVIRFDFRLSPGANNGLGIRCPLQAKGNLHLLGTEIQILDHTAEKYSGIKPYQFHGSVYGIAAAKREGLKPVGEWNTEEVTARGRQIKVVLNDVTIVDVNLDEATAQGTLDGADHPGLKRTSGHIGFLGHGDRIEVKNIWIKELKP